MPIFKNLDDLFNHIQKQINQALVDEVAPVVEKTLDEMIDANVYHAYTPSIYQRRGELGDPKNIQSELTEDGVLFTKNIAQPSPSILGDGNISGETTFSGWIDRGLVPNIFTNEPAPWQRPAMFIAETEDYLKKTQAVKKALQRALAKKGIKTV